MENIDELKNSISGTPRYKLKNATVYVSPGGYHYTDYLDELEDISTVVDGVDLTEKEIAYIETMLQSNSDRFENQAKIVQTHLPLGEKKVLDIGCGGGLFLSKLKYSGAKVVGIELSDVRAAYASKKYGIEIVKQPIESDYWVRYKSQFDAVTLWDVIEHVNYPLATLKSSADVLKKGGIIMIDTPCKDSFYHQAGQFTYRVSGGRFPTFLNTLYSSHKFGHKQIFSTSEMKALFERVGLEVIELRKFHELSFPYEFYLRKMFKSSLLVKIVLPLVKVAFSFFRVNNKMLVVGRKR